MHAFVRCIGPCALCNNGVAGSFAFLPSRLLPCLCLCLCLCPAGCVRDTSTRGHRSSRDSWLMSRCNIHVHTSSYLSDEHTYNATNKIYVGRCRLYSGARSIPGPPPPPPQTDRHYLSVMHERGKSLPQQVCTYIRTYNAIDLNSCTCANLGTHYEYRTFSSRHNSREKWVIQSPARTFGHKFARNERFAIAADIRSLGIGPFELQFLAQQQ